MIDQLPRWVWVAGGALSFAAGLMNAVGLLAFGAEAVTHLTGTTTLIAGHLGFGRWDSALHLLGILGAFCLGAVFSGWLIRDEHLRLGRRYTVALGIEALLVLAATQAFFWREPAAYYLLASAVGLQNAMATTFSGAVMRTSHLSGMFTDLAIYLGHALRGLPVAKKRIAVCLLVIGGFSSGALVGAWGMRSIGPAVLLVAAAIATGLAIAHALRPASRAGKV
ncbi:YoaK family protein [Silanimonas sp.]|jgi:uncharacterized membrane protein YoaK (UPF0700 family)|uniref:YoaK family protein n=1 Tax=Silanimonas sp. TaxID=1929290 RepID=UPI0022C7862C|nr:YoaK family protein [Silanimonas sp.]MCZ8165332.1 YoaK family protein [Silanimonas sp.]